MRSIPTLNTNTAVVKMLASVIVLMVVVLVASRWSSVDSARGQCTRSATGAKVAGAAFRAQSTYLNSVLAAASVKSDVKTAANKAQKVFNSTATVLESGGSDSIDCNKKNPWIPSL